MYIENRNLRGVQKFVDTKVVRRNSIGRIMVSANSVTPHIFCIGGDIMSTLKAYGNAVVSIFQLIGDKENDITKSIAWALNKCPVFMKKVVYEIFGINVDPDEVDILYHKYDAETGITDIEMTDGQTFHLIIEAKRGWLLPSAEQLTKYSMRRDFRMAVVQNKTIVSMSECSVEYAKDNLPFVEINGIPVKHLSWSKIFELAADSRADSNNEQKHLLEELKEYLGGIMTMQTKDSNWVYVVVLGSGKPDNCELTWIEIVKNYNKYFHPIGGNGWPKEPPNYIAFRYGGKLQAIHHIDDYVVTKNLHNEVAEMPDVTEDGNFFVYKLGPAIVPPKEVKNGKIYPNGRVWAMLDTLLTSDTISEARDISKAR